ncbi:MAG: tetratricopeptide repeat protein [Chitinivibrionales bacterium]|nr:tetratricopeptide repeat protein [Chitinivibrionales bacterium]
MYKRNVLLAFSYLSLSIGVLSVFSPTFKYDFINYDDNEYVYENPNIKDGLNLKSTKWAFAEFYAANWHPLTWISHALDIELFGLNPGFHHFTNVAIHVLNALVIFSIFLYLSKNILLSFFVSFVFAVHPLKSETVCWISERKDLLCAFFSFISIYSYLKHKIELSKRHYAYALLFFLCALLSKPMAITLPFVLLLLNYWPIRATKNEDRTQIARSLLPFFVLSIPAVFVTLWSQAGEGALAASISISDRLFNAFFSYVKYIRMFIYPNNLYLFYPFRSNFSLMQKSLPLILLVAISIISIAYRKKTPYLFVGWFIYVIMLIPVIGFIQAGSQAMADRYTYMPTIGLLIMLTGSVGYFYRKKPKALPALVVAATCGSALLAYLTIKQNAVWKNSQSLYSNAISKDPYNYLAYCNLGTFYLNNNQFGRAINYLRSSLAIYPGYRMALSNLGIAYLREAQKDSAKKYLELAIANDSTNSPALLHLGILHAQSGNDSSANDYIHKSCYYAQDDWEPVFRLGLLHLKNEKYYRAKKCLTQSLRLHSDNWEVYNALGYAHFRTKNYADAQRIYGKALELNSENPELFNTYGKTIFMQNRYSEAMKYYSRAIELNNDYALAYFNIAEVYERLNNDEKAILNYKISAHKSRKLAPAVYKRLEKIGSSPTRN